MDRYDRYDKIAEYSRIMDKIDSLRVVEANEEIDGLAFTKLDAAYELLYDARGMA